MKFADKYSSVCQVHNPNFNWQEETGGTGELEDEHDPSPLRDNHYQYNWVGGRWPEFGEGTSVLLPGTNQTVIATPGNPNSGAASYGSTDLTGSHGYIHYHFSDQSQLALITGDRPDSTSGELYQITGGAQETYYTSQYYELFFPPYFFYKEATTHTTAIPPEQIQVGALGRLDTNGTLRAALPAHTNVNVTPRVSGAGWRQTSS